MIPKEVAAVMYSLDFIAFAEAVVHKLRKEGDTEAADAIERFAAARLQERIAAGG